MSTITTNFPTASPRRSRVERASDSVIAGYIHSLAGTSARRDAARSLTGGILAERTGAAAVTLTAVDMSSEASTHSNTEERPGRKGDCSARGRRSPHSLRPQRDAAPMHRIPLVSLSNAAH